jgi:hypothetical protein
MAATVKFTGNVGPLFILATAEASSLGSGHSHNREACDDDTDSWSRKSKPAAKRRRDQI